MSGWVGIAEDIAYVVSYGHWLPNWQGRFLNWVLGSVFSSPREEAMILLVLFVMVTLIFWR